MRRWQPTYSHIEDSLRAKALSIDIEIVLHILFSPLRESHLRCPGGATASGVGRRAVDARPVRGAQGRGARPRDGRANFARRASRQLRTSGRLYGPPYSARIRGIACPKTNSSSQHTTGSYTQKRQTYRISHQHRALRAKYASITSKSNTNRR